ncbi:MAG: hypothetical protein P8M64_01015 [Thermodesulfobacteriota bacteirum]|nr:hypothetical protein [Thermodesulfobacteriota bacterium]
MKFEINKIPFLRDSGWIFGPVLYLLLILVSIIIFYYSNANQHYVDYTNNEIDGVSLNKEFTDKNLVYKAFALDSNEYLVVSDATKLENFNLNAKKSNLQNLNEISSFYSTLNNKVVSIGYISHNQEDCKKLKAISISRLGTHHMNTVDNNISEILIWNSKQFQYAFVNKFLSNGIDIKNICSYVVSSK